jgi:hypothetical protein
MRVDAVENAAVAAGQTFAYMSLFLFFCLLEVANDFEYKNAGGMRPSRAVRLLWLAIISAGLFFVGGRFFLKSPERACALFAGLTVLFFGVWEIYRLHFRMRNPVTQVQPKWTPPHSRKPRAFELLSLLSQLAIFGTILSAIWTKPHLRRKPGARKTAAAHIQPEAIVLPCCRFGFLEFLFLLLFAMPILLLMLIFFNGSSAP